MLNGSQRRRVSITFRMLEEDLFDIENRISTEGRAGVLYILENDIPPAVRKALKEKIALIRQGVRTVAGQFALEKETVGLRRRLIGELSLMGVSLEEVMAKRLRGYGEIAKGLQEALDPQLDQLRDNLYEMLGLLALPDVKAETGKEE